MHAQLVLSEQLPLEQLASMTSPVRYLVQTLSPSENTLHVLTNEQESIFSASIWTYIEPEAGIISACLPVLANVFGHSVINLLKTLSDWGARFTLSNTRKSAGTTPGTQRATYEAFDLDKYNQRPISAAMQLGTV